MAQYFPATGSQTSGWQASNHSPSHTRAVHGCHCSSSLGFRLGVQAEFFSDKKAVVAVLQSGTSRDPNMMVLLRFTGSTPLLCIYDLVNRGQTQSYC